MANDRLYLVISFEKSSKGDCSSIQKQLVLHSFGITTILYMKIFHIRCRRIQNIFCNRALEIWWKSSGQILSGMKKNQQEFRLNQPVVCTSQGIRDIIAACCAAEKNVSFLAIIIVIKQV